ncbi:hypothetical protein PAXRUDRAFT_490571 [Paxillus rubicundulus Ve08.2h10]|uniref:Uncharacterized protein n=1 Tax=Paxillus rubicundulus Ve08.2h10 TaxID=930991 RepID=A0A0D0E9N0_9AGAM|nr:hypothetical protein PAXRUDRAFT_490571 [Paxillus rubicundulus Ve08.2h10]
MLYHRAVSIAWKQAPGWCGNPVSQQAEHACLSACLFAVSSGSGHATDKLGHSRSRPPLYICASGPTSRSDFWRNLYMEGVAWMHTFHIASPHGTLMKLCDLCYVICCRSSSGNC